MIQNNDLGSDPLIHVHFQRMLLHWSTYSRLHLQGTLFTSTIGVLHENIFRVRFFPCK